MVLSEENKKYLKNVSPEERIDDMLYGFITQGYYDIEQYITLDDIEILIKKLKAFHNEHKTKYYRYLITFTLKEDTKDEITIEDYIKKQFKRRALNITKAYISKEYTKNKRPHWHVAVESKKYISKDRFNYYIKKFGFIDISKTNSQNLDNTIKYISKETEPTKIH